MAHLDWAVGQGCSKRQSLGAMGLAKSTFYRWRSPPAGPKARVRRPPANRLSWPEQKLILSLLHHPRFVDQSPYALYYGLLNEGIWLASVRTMYRLLAAHREVRERRRIARHPKVPKPILLAHQPLEVWTWDITRLPGPCRGRYFYLYVMLDLYSRYVVGWMVARQENSHLAKHFLRECMRKAQQSTHISRLTIHSDRGAPMTAHTTRDLLDVLGVRQSFSRPRVSNDNPFSEAQFRTLKYHALYPGFFQSEAEANSWLESFFHGYNECSPHSGLAGFTPAQVHHGEVETLIRKRQAALNGGFAEHPERFSRGRPKAKRPPNAVGINALVLHKF